MPTWSTIVTLEPLAKVVIPVKTGIHLFDNLSKPLDSRLRGNELKPLPTTGLAEGQVGRLCDSHKSRNSGHRQSNWPEKCLTSYVSSFS